MRICVLLNTLLNPFIYGPFFTLKNFLKINKFNFCFKGFKKGQPWPLATYQQNFLLPLPNLPPPKPILSRQTFAEQHLLEGWKAEEKNFLEKSEAKNEKINKEKIRVSKNLIKKIFF